MMRSRSTLLTPCLALCLSLPLSGLPLQTPPGVVIDHQDASTRQYIGSPSIVIAPDGSYIASHDLFGPGSSSTTSAVTRIFVSEDRGATWRKTAEVSESFWPNLFVVRGRVYLLGSTREYGQIAVRTSDDNGRSWSEPHYLTRDSGYHTAPVPVVIREGRIYRAYEYHPTGPWGSFQAFVMSAPVDADLTDASSWRFSDRLSFPVGDEGDTWLEGNAVVAPDGSLLDILRVNNQSHIALLRLTGTSLKLDRFAELPGGATKFTIRFDPVSRLYWTLSNPALPGEPLAVSSPASVRNTLAVMSSEDLLHWTPRAIVAHHPDSQFHAFQYVDWQFDGDDLIAVSRTSFDDGAGGAHSYHDANFMTFHRITAFRQLGRVKLDGAPFAAAEVVSDSQMGRWIGATATDAARSEAGIFTQQLGRYGSHETRLTTRVRTGDAEAHHEWCDIYVVTAGAASLVSGGRLVDGREIAPGEMRGRGIEGGVSQPLRPGSVVHINRDIPHQLIVDPASPFTYLVVKVRSGAALQP